ncbi:MAG: hypothetical protein V1760_00520 [Candidatus Peregrinibacteria bacterium]
MRLDTPSDGSDGDSSEGALVRAYPPSVSVLDGKPVFAVSPRFNEGNEHHVYRSRDDDDVDWVIKTPRRFYGALWQDMSADATERDLEVLDQYRVPVIHTDFFRDAYCQVLEGVPRRHAYVLRQPGFWKYPNIYYADIAKNPALLDALLEILEVHHRIYRDCQLGMDILGGTESHQNLRRYIYDRFLRSFVPGVLPVPKFRMSLPNLLNPQENIDHQSQRIVQAGKVILGDVRLFRLGQPEHLSQFPHFYRRLIRAYLEFLYHVETGAAVGMVKRHGRRPENGIEDFSSAPYRCGEELADWILRAEEAQAAISTGTTQ